MSSPASSGVTFLGRAMANVEAVANKAGAGAVVVLRRVREFWGLGRSGAASAYLTSVRWVVPPKTRYRRAPQGLVYN